MPTPQHIVAKLVETVHDPRTNRYSSSRGIQGLRKAQAAYYGRRFGVKLSPDTQVVATLGSKEGFANVAQAITAPGDVILVPNPTYPIHEFGFIMSGGVIRHLPARTDSQFMTSLDKAVRHSVPKPSALVLNYPANPTAVVADLDFYREVVALRQEARPDRSIRPRLCRDLFRWRAAALDPSGPRRHRHRCRVHHAIQDLRHARLARRLRRRQRAPDPRAQPREVLSRLWRLHPGPGGRRRRAERTAKLHRRDPRHL